MTRVPSKESHGYSLQDSQSSLRPDFQSCLIKGGKNQTKVTSKLLEGTALAHEDETPHVHHHSPSPALRVVRWEQATHSITLTSSVEILKPWFG